MKYRKKPVVIEAMQYTGDNFNEIKAFAGASVREIVHHEPYGTITIVIIQTLNGALKVSDGDYVIKGVRGEFYPCKPDTFDATHEEVTDEK